MGKAAAVKTAPPQQHDTDEREVQIQPMDTGALGTLARADIEQQIATAHRFPRSISSFRKECMAMATLTESIADECIYALPRGSKTIEGPSARFAEIVANAWGNCRAAARVVDEDEEFVTAQGVFHDLEKNVAISYEVRRRITDSNGRRYNTDMIGVTANAACSISLRNAILKGVPKAFWNDMYEAARQTVMGDAKTLANRRAEAIAHFVKFGVSEKQICAKLGKAGVEDIGLEDLLTLRGIATAIKEGDTTAEQAFAPEGNGKAAPAAQAAAPALTDEQLAQHAQVRELCRKLGQNEARASMLIGQNQTDLPGLIEKLKSAVELAAPDNSKPVADPASSAVAGAAADPAGKPQPSEPPGRGSASPSTAPPAPMPSGRFSF